MNHSDRNNWKKKYSQLHEPLETREVLLQDCHLKKEGKKNRPLGFLKKTKILQRLKENSKKKVGVICCCFFVCVCVVMYDAF